ncbi:MAG: hypothetical protein R2705_14220 [Ilumatobacteraceae bacterium]
MLVVFVEFVASDRPRREPKNATPATIEMASVGSAAPSTAPTATLTRWTIAVAAVMASRIVEAR